MIHLLIAEIDRLCHKFQDGKYTMKMLYEDASIKLCEAGYEANAYRVEKKWNNLVSTYRNVLNRVNTYGEDAITRRYEYFEEMHKIMGNMNTVRGKSLSSPLCETLPGTSRTRSSSPASPASTPASPTSSPEPKQKRMKKSEDGSPQTILVPAVRNHKQIYSQHQRGPPQKRIKREKQQIDDDQDDIQSVEARREWREWKRQQELINVHHEGHKVLESIDSNLAAIRKSLEFIVQKLSNQ